MDSWNQCHAISGAKELPNVPSWWQLELQESSSEELEAASYYGEYHTGSAVTDELPVQIETATAPSATHQFLQTTANVANQNSGSADDGRIFRNPIGAREGSATPAILEVIKKSMCNYDSVQDQSLPSCKNAVPLQLENLDNAALQMWQEFSESSSFDSDSDDGDYDDDDDSFCPSSGPPSPLPRTAVSCDELLEIIDELENELAELRGGNGGNMHTSTARSLTVETNLRKDDRLSIPKLNVADDTETGQGKTKKNDGADDAKKLKYISGKRRQKRTKADTPRFQKGSTINNMKERRERGKGWPFSEAAKKHRCSSTSKKTLLL